MMRERTGWHSCDSYIEFLKLQYQARRPVEGWLIANAPEHLRPPLQCDLILQDLTALGMGKRLDASSTSETPFDIGSGSKAEREAKSLGAAWTLAGSSLGNRSILKEIGQSSSHSESAPWPHSFLADPKMLAFWGNLRRLIERPAAETEICQASQASLAVFDHFIMMLRDQTQKTKAADLTASKADATSASQSFSCPAISL